MKSDNVKIKIYIILSGILFLLLFGSMPFFAKAATYYVDSSRPDDSGNGLSQGTAWKTIDKVNKSTFLPGDNILFKRGGVWRGQLKPASSGIENSPITYAAYGSGNNPLVINGKFFSAGISWGMANEFGEYSLEIGDTVEFSKSSIVGVLRGQPQGIDTYKRLENATSTPGLLEEDQYAIDLIAGKRIIRYKPIANHKPDEYDWEFSKWNGTVFLGPEISWVVVDGFSFYNSYYDGHSVPEDTGVIDFFGSHCTVKNSIIKFANAFGVEFAGTASQYNTLENCDIQYGRSAGVDLRRGASHNTVRGCHIANNSLGTTLEETFNDRGGIMTVGQAAEPITHILVEGNIIHDNGNSIPTRNNAAILMDGCQYWTVRNNYIYNSPRRAIATSDNDGTSLAKNHHLNIQYNIIRNWNTNREPYSWNSGLFVTAKGNDTESGYNKIENNTFYSSENISLIGINLLVAYPSTDFMRNTSVRNNIVYLANNTQLDSVGIRLNKPKTNYPGMLMDNNLVFGSPNLYESPDQSRYNSAFSFYQVSGFGQNDKNSNPLFTNASGNFSQASDFQLSSSSPAKDAGIDVGLTADYAGTAVPQNSTPDIGAYEYFITYSAADINQDQAVNLADFNLLKSDFLKLTGSLTNPKSDIDGDGQATIKDVGILMSGWK